MTDRDLDKLLDLAPSHEKTVPMVRLLPDGRMVTHDLQRSRLTAMLAWRFIAHGGRYLVALVEEDGKEFVRLCAIVPEAPGNPTNGNILVESKCRNDAEFPRAVDNLVRGSLDALDAMQ